MSDVKKFVKSSDADLVSVDKVLRAGDWVLKWDPKAPDDQTGFALFTPKDFDPEKGGGPLGGLVLAAVYFLIENGPSDFHKELVARANALARDIERTRDADGGMVPPVGRTLN